LTTTNEDVTRLRQYHDHNSYKSGWGCDTTYILHFGQYL